MNLTPGVGGFDTLLADLAALEAGGAADPGAAYLPPSDPGLLRLGARVRLELIHVSVLTAVATGIANALERPLAPVDPRGLAAFAPGHSSFFAGAIDRLIGEDAGADLCDRLQTYGARLALAQRMSRSFARDDGAGVPAPHVDAEILADAWRRACSAAIQAIEALEPCNPGASRRTDTLESVRVLNLLRMAESGEAPCLEPDGRITIPGWAERRREPRIALRLEATTEIGGETMAIVIRNVSLSGLGLDCTGEIAPGTRLTVRLPGDRVLRGVVAWADVQRVGVRLDQRLEPDDPLLAGAPLTR